MPWEAVIRVNRNWVERLGYFPNEESAAREYDRAARICWPGDTTVLNFPVSPPPRPPSETKSSVKKVRATTGVDPIGFLFEGLVWSLV